MLKEMWEQAQDLWEQAQEQMGVRQRDFRKDLQRSSEAQELLDNPLLQEFFEETEKDCIHQWLSTKANQLEEREAAYQLVNLLRKLRNDLQTFVDQKDYALQQLQETEKVD